MSPTSVTWAVVDELVGVAAEVLGRREAADALRITDPVARRAHLAGRALTRVVLARALGVGPEEVPALRRDCEHCGGPHGRPRLPGGTPSLSLSRAGGVVAVAVSGCERVGLDVVRTGEQGSPLPEVEELLHPAELARWQGAGAGRWLADGAGRRRTSTPGTRPEPDLARTWARKEALLKATGHGLAVPPAAVEIGADCQPAAGTAWSGLTLHDLRVGDLVGALALDGPAGDDGVRVLRWHPTG